MIRKLLATTAIAGVLATAAAAQTTAPATTTEPAANGSMGTSGTMAPGGAMGTNGAAMNNGAMSTGQTADQSAPAANIAYVQSQGADQYMATDIRGMTLYSGDAADAQSAGEIENLVIGEDGAVVAAVVDTGNFLGDQSRTIAIPFDQIRWTQGENNAPRAVLTASRDQLMSAPAFEMNETAANNAAATGNTMAPAATGGMAPAGTMAPGGAMGSTAATGGATTPATTPSTDMAAATTAPATTGSSAGTGEYLATLGPNQYLSANLIGENVYNGHDTSSENIGEINDLVVASSGRVEAVLIGVGGFLGIGEKDVGVPFDAVSMMRGENNEPHLMLAANRDQLTNAPAFESSERVADAGTNANMSGAGMGAGGTTLDTASATAPNTTTGNGMAAGTTAAAGAAATGAAATGAMGTDATATASTNNADNGSLTPVTGAELTADNLIGTAVSGPDNARIGSIGDIALTPEGQVDAVIVDVGGFLGIGAKPVAVAMDNLQFMRDSGGKLTLTTQFTQDQLRNAPEFNRDTYAENRDQMRVANPGDIPAGSAAQQ
ncbi:PRC-barrel domain-containing protein [Aureimonas jatrophae]|uniref:PRC-barrel domain-containing protein n=1 Tax=Aureimonas jatrophae TaxID=1166073 RepID=A0A1H0EKF1_9HYPH|nr:PRC-barrel domain-containing protein [Aureimonas jatrophae]MBB3950457.1 hypothetical protein [Aureimonas jatrophae]SDN82785.1 PRC-barrel domain-containing protein [Aureimonas jatrophae]